MIVATAVLHNNCINQRIQLPESEILPPRDNDDFCYNSTLHDVRRTRENVALGLRQVQGNTYAPFESHTTYTTLNVSPLPDHISSVQVQVPFLLHLTFFLPIISK